MPVIKLSVALLILSVLLAASAAGLRLFVDESPSLNVGDAFHTSLAFSDQYILPEHVTNSDACVFISGDVCGCWSGFYGAVGFVWTEDCIRSRDEAMARAQSYYASLLLVPTVNGEKSMAPGVRRTLASAPAYMASGTPEGVTLVLPLTIDDLSRSLVLLRTLHKMETGVVAEMLAFVPDQQLTVIRGALLGAAAALALSFKLRVLSELDLFHIRREELKQMYPYAIQMAIKLLVAEHISTSFYLTLDADILQLRGFNIQSVIRHLDGSSVGGRQGPPGRAVYHWEERAVHEAWWKGSERVLNVSLANSYAYQRWHHQDNYDGPAVGEDGGINDQPQRGNIGETQRRVQGFGVTPALLSTYGSQLTLFHLCRTLTRNWDYRAPIDKAQCERIWLGNFGHRVEVGAQQQRSSADPAGEVWLWSEYTLYRIVLDHYEVFDELHQSEEEAGVRLHCHNVWFAGQLPWPAEEASRVADCLFSVVQSTTGVAPSAVLSLYERHLG